jgi:DnaK suppressor protein
MNKRQTKHIEKRLHEERDRASRDLARYGEAFSGNKKDSNGEIASYSFHMADQGTDAMEREKQFLFASKEGRYLWHVKEALRRLYETPDKFGLCQECGTAVGYERLDALPHARLCIDCKAKEEDGVE